MNCGLKGEEEALSTAVKLGFDLQKIMDHKKSGLVRSNGDTKDIENLLYLYKTYAFISLTYLIDYIAYMI